MTFTPEQLRAQLQHLSPAGRLWVAFSGGLDSVVLLHALLQLDLPQRVAALHINHQMSAHAADWVHHCTLQCQALGVPLSVEKIQVKSAGRGVEDAARQARYDVFERYLQPGDSLLTGHHADDQAETLLFRLLRGTGPRGLAAMARQRPLGTGSLLRPLLSVPRQALEHYARAQGLSWVEDDSNSELIFDRNYLRHRVLPVLAERWPGYTARWQQSAELCAENETLLEELAQLDLNAAQPQPEWAGWSLAVRPVQALSLPRRFNLLRFWLRQLGVPVPGRKALQQVDERLLSVDKRHGDYAWGDWQLRRFQQRLYVLQSTQLHQSAPEEGPISFTLTPDLDHQVPFTQGGALHLYWQSTPAAGLLRADLAYLQVRWRQGGERARPHDRNHSQTLKKLLQEANLPPWWRPPVPLLYSGDELVAVGDLWVCHGFTAPPGASGFRLHWQRNALGPDALAPDND